MKKFTITILLLVFLGSIGFSWISFSKKTWNPVVSKPDHSAHPVEKKLIEKFKAKVTEAKNFIRSKSYNDRFCFLIDMSISSGQNRFFVYDLEKDSILKRGLVTHGRCNEDWLEGRRYDNKVGCGCTSLGKYKIGNAYMGRFGLAFKLYGLDKTNDKAYERYVVLHAHECVPDEEVSREICQSDGCPTVAPEFLSKLEPLIKNSNKPVLLWIFE